MDISIPDPLRAWVEAQVASGQYESADAYVGDLILRDRLSLLDHGSLVDALVASEESGISPRRVPDILADLKREFDGGRG